MALVGSSYNNYANLLFIDQPIKVGYSYGNTTVNSTVEAAPYVWNLLQAFYSSFPEYKSRDFGIFTESYGGHYGSEFAKYILDQNEADVGETINLVALGINNGWIDPAIQIPSYATFSYNNSHRSLVSKPRYDTLMAAALDECVPALEKCADTGSDMDCVNANTTCYTTVEGPIYDEVYFDAYDVRDGFENAGPDNSKITPYLESQEVTGKLGAKSAFQPFPQEIWNSFVATGDSESSYTPSELCLSIPVQRSFLDSLSEVVSAGVTTLIWSGDAE
ncbi:unnamed protein product [Alternaria alternata]